MRHSSTKNNFRHYLYFLFGQQFSILGSLIVGFSITWWITIETGSAIYLSISTFLMFLPQIIITPFAGVISDRWNKKLIIAISDTMQALLTFLLFVFFLLNFESIWFVLLINTFRASCSAFQLPAVYSLIPMMVPQQNLSRINGMNSLFSGVIYSVGPIVAATLLSFYAIQEIFLIDIFSFLLAFFPLIFIKIPKIEKNTNLSPRKSFFKDFKEGFNIIKLIPGLVALICLAMLWNFIYRPWAVLMPYFIKYIHNGNALDLAFIMTSNQLANILGSAIITIKKNWQHKIRINIFGAVIVFLTQIPAILAPRGNFLFMIIFLFSGTILVPITVSNYLAIIQVVVPKEKIGRVMSIDHMISMAIAPIGALIAGPLAELWGIVNLFLICAALGLIFPIGIRLFTKINQLEIIEREHLEQEKSKNEFKDKEESQKEYEEILDEQRKLITPIESLE
jgi:DHA3 family macrolide efflux protein-like MFS transporter